MSSRRSKNNKKEVENKQVKRKKLISISLLIFIGILIGFGTVVHNLSEIYMLNKNTVQVSSPIRIMKDGSNVLLISTNDFDGKPKSDVPVSLELEYNNENYILFSGKTDETGSVQPVFELPALEYDNNEVELLIKAGSEEVKKKVRLNSPIKIFISTDKPIYQPLHVIHIRALCFNGNSPLGVEDNVRIEIQDPESNKIFREDFFPNEFGIINLNYTLSDQLPLGNYKIVVSAEGEAAVKTVLVKKYVLPKFKIGLEEVKTWYTVNEPIKGNVTCNYFFGKKVQGDVEIEVKSYLGVWETIDDIKGELVEGKMSFEIDPIRYSVGVPSNVDNGYLELNVTVTDTGGHKESDIKTISIARKPIVITLLSDSNIEGTESEHYIIARYPDGRPAAEAEVNYIFENRNGYYLYNWDKKSKVTDTRGVAKINFNYTDQNQLTIEVSDHDQTVTEEYYMKGSKGIKVFSDNNYYDIGEVAKFHVKYTGDKASTDFVYYDVSAKGFITGTGHIKLNKNNQGSFSIPVTADLAPLAEIRVYKTQTDLNVVRDVAIIGIGTENSNLNVNITTDKELYLPNDAINFEFEVTDNGEPVRSAIGVSIVDQSVFEVHERFSGLELVMQNLEAEFISPQYQICNYVYSPNSPASSVPDETESVVSKQEISLSWRSEPFTSSGKSHLNYSLQLENYYVGIFWFLVILLGLIGFAALFVLAFKYRKARAAVMILLFFLPIILFFSMIGWLISIDLDDDFDVTSQGIKEEQRLELERRNDFWTDPSNNSGNSKGQGGSGGRTNVEPSDEKKASSGDSSNIFESAGKGKTGLDIDFNSDLQPPEKDSFGDGESGSGYGGNTVVSVQKPVQTRQYFPETWYWNPWLITDNNGKAELTLNTPDSITTWNMEAVATTKDAKFGMGTEEITVFKGFFIEPDLPLSAIRNDEFPLKVLIYNYEEEAGNVTVTLNEESWFELLSDSNTNTTFVNSSSVSSVEFRIRALDVGDYLLTVSGDNGLKIDRVVKQMEIEPDGKKVNELINGALENDQVFNSTLVPLQNRIPNSEDAFLKLQGGIEAITLDGAEDYIQFVSGCGEQSTSRLSVDIAAYRNLMKGDIVDEKLLEHEITINQGIQHEMMYVKSDASGLQRYVVWHNGGPADMWLTAWAAFAFQDLDDAGFIIDEKILPGFHNYMLSEQSDDGSYKFPDVGHWSINSKLQNSKLTSTAYVTRALLYSGYSKTATAVEKSVNYIINNIGDNKDPYTVALALLVLEQADSGKNLRDTLASRLESSKVENLEDETVSWSWIESSSSSFDRGYSNDIETTAYAIMALNEHGLYYGTVNKAVKHLLTHRSGGCFGSTHDTAVAFQALNSIDALIIDEITVSININDKDAEPILFNDDNKDITYLIDLRPYLGNGKIRIKLESKGSGLIFYQIYMEQYIPWNKTDTDTPKEIELDITYDTTTIRVNDIITANLKLKYNGEKEVVKMILIDLRAPVGFSFIESEFLQMLDDGIINNYEISGRQAFVYLDDVKKGVEISFSYSLLANKPIKGKIQGIHAFDMYNTDLDVRLEPVMVESTE